MAERGEYLFTIKENTRGEFWIAAEPAGDTIKSLDGRVLGFDLRREATHDDARRFPEPEHCGDHAELKRVRPSRSHLTMIEIWPSWKAKLRRQLVRQSKRQVGDRFRKAHPHPRKPEYISAPLRIVHVLRERQAFPCSSTVFFHHSHGASHQDGPLPDSQI